MENTVIKSDQMLMALNNNVEQALLEKTKHCDRFSFKKSGKLPDLKYQLSGLTGSVCEREAN